MVAFYAPNGIGNPGFHGFSAMLQVGRSENETDTNRSFVSDHFGDTPVETVNTEPTSLESARITIEYDPETGMLTSSANGNTILAFDIGGDDGAALNDWDMQDTGQFGIAIAGDSFNEQDFAENISETLICSE